jgi:predicted acylesterase/phospholipase RssA
MLDERPIRPVNDERLEDLRRWYPVDRAKSDPPRDDTFEIALVIAGGQSAGCYSAGVLDFLFEALDAWYVARQSRPDLPNHHVRFKIIVGSSAGGLNAALAAIALRYRFPPANKLSRMHPETDRANPFYRAWVQDIDVTNLLATDDFSGDTAPASVLNSAYLTRKVADYLDFTGEAEADASSRSYLEDPLPVRIMVSNLDGVPYDIRFTAERGDDREPLLHHMSLHQDHVAFQRVLFGPDPSPSMPDHQPLPQANDKDSPAWRTIGDAALATVAFPFLFEQRRIGRPNTDYDYRFAYYESPDAPVYAAGFPGARREHMSFEALDGGVMNNEPFELAHDALAGTRGQNPRAGKDAKRAVILIDPFVDPMEPDASTSARSLIGVVGRLFGAFKDQSRFKHIDLELAQSDEVYSRFMIAPVRKLGRRTIYGDRALASRPLAALLGYLSIHYRHHDFMLGRENCHRFLRDWFVLPCAKDNADGAAHGDAGNPGNSLFSSWSATALANSAFKSQSDRRPEHRQIIPLVEPSVGWPQVPVWPAGRFAGFSTIREPLKSRLTRFYPGLRSAVAEQLAGGRIARFLISRLIDLVWWAGGRNVLLSRLGSWVDEAKRAIDEG